MQLLFIGIYGFKTPVIVNPGPCTPTFSDATADSWGELEGV